MSSTLPPDDILNKLNFILTQPLHNLLYSVTTAAQNPNTQTITTFLVLLKGSYKDLWLCKISMHMNGKKMEKKKWIEFL